MPDGPQSSDDIHSADMPLAAVDPQQIDDAWAALAEPFVEGAYASVKGQVRTFVLHHQLLKHLPPPPADILDIGGGAAHQSLPLARLGYDITLLEPSTAMLEKARHRLGDEPAEVRDRVQMVQARGEEAVAATGGRNYDAVLCHGVLMYLDDPQPMIDALCRCVAPGGLVSVMALNADTLAVRPALEGRWADALAAFDADSEIGVLGTQTRADSVDGLSALLNLAQIEVEARYGVWLFTDWLDLPFETTDIAAVAEAELQASLRDPYRQLSRVFHLVGRRPSG